MKTGTDISLRVCRSEGYAVIEHHGKKLKPKQCYHVTISNPTVWESGRRSPAYEWAAREPYLENTWLCYQELWDQFQAAGEKIKEYCDFANCPYPAPEENPTFHDMAHLAQTLHYYCGIE